METEKFPLLSKEKYAEPNSLKANTFRDWFPKKQMYESKIKLKNELGPFLKKQVGGGERECIRAKASMDIITKETVHSKV